MGVMASITTRFRLTKAAVVAAVPAVLVAIRLMMMVVHTRVLVAAEFSRVLQVQI